MSDEIVECPKCHESRLHQVYAVYMALGEIHVDFDAQCLNCDFGITFVCDHPIWGDGA